MVASISARGNAKAALRYYDHLGRDDYYARGGEGAERLSLRGPVTQAEFEAALSGLDPKTGDRLAQQGGHAREHSAGWDMTFSAPKSVSVLWALSDELGRRSVEQAHQSAVQAATGHLERTAAWARRGKGGAIREPTAGLLMAQFDHHTSRESDPQLHTHSFVFNLAPRRDGSWGAIVSRELYKSQKNAGAIYRRELANELERRGHRLDRQKDGFRVFGIPREVERAFSKRRQAIEDAARTHGYRTPKGMELAALRTRRPKRDAKFDDLFKNWQAEAKALGFELNRDRQQARQPAERYPRIDLAFHRPPTGAMHALWRRPRRPRLRQPLRSSAINLARRFAPWTSHPAWPALSSSSATRIASTGGSDDRGFRDTEIARAP
jgi:conjugative relaxase-like TrwC/TraI family protein